MAKLKIAITVDGSLLSELDALERERHGRLARESAKLDPAEEKRFAEEGLDDAVEQWPQY